MKTMGNLKWKLALCVIGLAVMVGATFMALGTPVLSAPVACTVTVDLSALPVGAQISTYPWNSYYTNTQTFVKNQGDTVTWRLIVGPFTGNTFNYTVPNTTTAILTVGPDAYCKMKVINVPAGGKIDYYPWNNSWTNNQEVFVPIGGSCQWKLTLNGFSGNVYTKNFDCTPLDAKQAWIYVGQSFCDMKVQMAADLVTANAQVNVYPWNTYWVNNQIITVPKGASCTWKLIVNSFGGKTFTKNFDCTALVVDSSAYYMMKVVKVPDGMKVNVYPWNTYWDNTTIIAVPIGGSCTWKLTGPGAPATQHVKNFDNTDLDATITP